MATRYHGFITDEMEAFSRAIIIADTYFENNSDTDPYFRFIQRMFYEAMDEGVSLDLIEMYVRCFIVCDENLINSHLNSSWTRIKYELNAHVYKRLSSHINDPYIECICGDGPAHLYNKKHFFCSRGNLVYETFSQEFMTTVHRHINEHEVMTRIVALHRRARPPMRLSQAGAKPPLPPLQFFNRLVLEEDFPTSPFYLERREEALEAGGFVETNYIPPVWLGRNPNFNEPITVHDADTETEEDDYPTAEPAVKKPKLRRN